MIIFKRLRQKINKIFNLPSQKQREEAKRIGLLRNQRKSDLQRWSKTEMLQDSWNDRTAILGDHIRPGSKVVEFGAANMFLNTYLGDKVTYQGVDIVERKEGMMIYDLNTKPFSFNLQSYDTAVLSGVLEYVYDIEYLFQTFSKAKIQYLLFSYACIDFCNENRFHNGWLSDFKHSDIKTIIKDSGYVIEKEILWRNQHLFMAVLSP